MGGAGRRGEGGERVNEDDVRYKVVVNREEQYSIWPAERENAPDWRDVGKRGSKEECLAHISEIWTDLRPLSLRRHMDAASGFGR